jgi:hypothetical protein
MLGLLCGDIKKVSLVVKAEEVTAASAADNTLQCTSA